MRVVNRLLPLAVLAVMILSLVGCSSSFSDPDLGDTVKKVGGAYDEMAASARPFDRSMMIGQVVAVSDKADVTLHSVSRDVQGWSAPGAGKELVVLDLTLVNRSSADLDIDPLVQLQLTDLGNNQYQALEAKGFDPLEAGSRTLAPGASTRGQVAFALPSGSRHAGLVWTHIAPAVLIIEGLDAS